MGARAVVALLINTRSADAAVKVMNVARGAAGIKRCSVISIRDDGAHVLSLTDTKRIETLTHVDGAQLLTADYVAAVVRVVGCVVVVRCGVSSLTPGRDRTGEP